MSNTLYHVSVKGTGSYAPKRVVSNDDLAQIIDTSDEWIRTRTGIANRHITETENTSILAYQAAKNAIDAAKVNALDVELIIVATVSPDSFTPSTACIVQDLLGAKKAVAFDVNAACTGLVFGITIATQFIENGVYKNALVIGAETLSKLLDWNDRSTCVLFGDGASAVYLEKSVDETGIIDVVLHADGSKGSFLECKAMPIKNFLTESEQGLQTQQHISMQGGEVFKFAVKTIFEGVREILKRQNLSLAEIDYIIPHQANIRIIESAAKLLKTDQNKFYVNLADYGNTSSASIGIALDELSRTGKLKKGQKIILVGFGGGMTSGSLLLEW